MTLHAAAGARGGRRRAPQSRREGAPHAVERLPEFPLPRPRGLLKSPDGVEADQQRPALVEEHLPCHSIPEKVPATITITGGDEQRRR